MSIVRFGPPAGESNVDVLRDGKRFIAVLAPSATRNGLTGARQVNVVLNWQEELKQRVPTK